MTKCKSCGASVEWHKIDNKWFCFNAGTTIDHWDSCSQKRFERIKATGEHFKTDKQEGYLTDLKKSGVQLVLDKAPLVKGKKFVSNKNCQNCVLPWEVCPNKCPVEFNKVATS